MSDPRVLTIMGSGETAATMGRVHRALFDRFESGSSPVTATVIDTPYGFQENADDISAKIVEYFAGRIGRPMTVASYRSSTVDALTAATALARLGEARYVLAGPGSPSYALRHWAGGPIPEALAAKLANGGMVTMASAAALTAGVVTVPVYEIYKVGADPEWLTGLDLLGPATGMRAAIVPHYDNAEGGNHDTRFCYIGERRLRILERSLPPGVFILGVDSHTALVLDLGAGTASVFGLGGVTVRVAGRSRTFNRGTKTTIEALIESASDLAGPIRDGAAGQEAGRAAPIRPAGAGSAGPGGRLREAVAQHETAFVAALMGHDIRGAVAALLALDAAIDRSAGNEHDGPELRAARVTSRSLLVRLAELAADGTHDRREIVAPYVETLLEMRTRARAAHDWAMADLVRERLSSAGVEVRDDPEGSTWSLAEPDEP